MSITRRSAKKQARTRQRRRLTAQERLARDRCQAQQAAEALEQALLAQAAQADGGSYHERW